MEEISVCQSATFIWRTRGHTDMSHLGKLLVEVKNPEEPSKL